MVRALIVCAVFGLTARAVAQDQVQVSETFDTYSTTTLTTISSVSGGNSLAEGTGWKNTEGWFLQSQPGAGGAIESVSGDMRIRTDGSSGPITGYLSRQFNSAFAFSSSPVWVSFRLQTTSVQAIASPATTHNAIELHNGDYVSNLAFSLTTSGNRTTVPATPGGPINQVRWSINGFDDSATAGSPADDFLHFVVIELNGSTATVWFDPALGGTPPGVPFTTTTITPSSFDRVVITAEYHSNVAIDDIRIGNTWLAVSSPTIPWVTSISPNQGTTQGNTQVTVSGRNYGSGMSVKFGATLGSAPSVLSSTALTTSSPSESVGTVSMEVANASGSVLVPNAFTYVTPSASFPANVNAPQILGTVVLGNSVTATPGTWNPALTNFHYEWQAANDGAGAGAGVAVGSIDSTNYTIGETVGRWLRVKVTANGADPASAAYSDWVEIRNVKPTTQEIASMEAVGPKCGGGSALGVIALSPLLLLRRRRAASEQV